MGQGGAINARTDCSAFNRTDVTGGQVSYAVIRPASKICPSRFDNGAVHAGSVAGGYASRARKMVAREDKVKEARRQLPSGNEP